MKVRDRVFRVTYDSIEKKHILGTYQILAVRRTGLLKIFRVDPANPLKTNETVSPQSVFATRTEAVNHYHKILLERYLQSHRELCKYEDEMRLYEKEFPQCLSL